MLKSKFIVTCICHGDTCDGHVEKIGTALSLEEAEDIIKDDKSIFIGHVKANSDDPDNETFTGNQHEIWHDDQNGRVYDVIEV